MIPQPMSVSRHQHARGRGVRLVGVCRLAPDRRRSPAKFSPGDRLARLRAGRKSVNGIWWVWTQRSNMADAGRQRGEALGRFRYELDVGGLHAEGGLPDQAIYASSVLRPLSASRRAPRILLSEESWVSCSKTEIHTSLCLFSATVIAWFTGADTPELPKASLPAFS